MTDHALEGLMDQPVAFALLEAYARAEAEAAAASPPAETAAPADEVLAEGESEEADRSAHWVPRLSNVAGTDPSTLPALHGQLIALGMLRFELFGRTGGMRYRLSPLGRSSLQKRLAAVASPEPATDELAAA